MGTGQNLGRLVLVSSIITMWDKIIITMWDKRRFPTCGYTLSFLACYPPRFSAQMQSMSHISQRLDQRAETRPRSMLQWKRSIALMSAPMLGAMNTRSRPIMSSLSEPHDCTPAKFRTPMYPGSSHLQPELIRASFPFFALHKQPPQA
jgi:hypothetical protein